jgi:LemA protein
MRIMPILIVIAVVLLIILAIYNGLVKSKNKVKQAESGIDVYLNQRFDLIPNLVECVKAYSKHEQSIFTEIAHLRSEYMKQSKNIKSAENLNNKMNQLIAVAENYPELKASEQYLNLQKTLTKLESQLQAARRIYNSEVTDYNSKINVVPSNIVAKLFGFKEAKLFEIEDYKKENINIKLED